MNLPFVVENLPFASAASVKFHLLSSIPRVGTLKFSVYIGEADFFGVKILNFRIFLGFQKN